MGELKIALVGKSRVGKSSVAEYLSKEYDFSEYTFGHDLKKQFHKQNQDVPIFPKPRAMYQSFGQNMRKQYGEDIWVNACFNRIQRAVDFFKKGTEFYQSNVQFPICISDVRQPNEMKRCKEEGYITIKIISNDEARLDRMNKEHDNFTMNDLLHDTESHIKGFKTDYVIVNNSSLKELQTTIDDIIEENTQSYRLGS